MFNAIMCLVIFEVAFGVSLYLVVNSFKCLKKDYWEEMIAKVEALNEMLNEMKKELNK